MEVTTTPKITVEKQGRKQVIAVNGTAVATLYDNEAADLFRTTLVNTVSRTEAVYDTMKQLGECRVCDVAKVLDMDRANVHRLVHALEAEGRVTLVTIHRAGRGRPAQVYRVIA